MMSYPAPLILLCTSTYFPSKFFPSNRFSSPCVMPSLSACMTVQTYFFLSKCGWHHQWFQQDIRKELSLFLSLHNKSQFKASLLKTKYPAIFEKLSRLFTKTYYCSKKIFAEVSMMLQTISKEKCFICYEITRIVSSSKQRWKLWMTHRYQTIWPRSPIYSSTLLLLCNTAFK